MGQETAAGNKIAIGTVALGGVFSKWDVKSVLKFCDRDWGMKKCSEVPELAVDTDVWMEALRELINQQQCH